MPAVDGLACNAELINDWGSGYQLEVTVSNPGEVQMEGWTLELSFAQAHNFTGGWNAQFSEQGNVITASDMGWNGSLQPGQSVSFGVQGSHDNDIQAPECEVIGSD